MRGISIEPFQRRIPDQIISTDSFTEVMLDTASSDPENPVLGFLFLESPYMHTSPAMMISMFNSAVLRNISPEMYGYLDGVYIMHDNQQPAISDNVGDLISNVSSIAVGNGLSPQFLLCSQSAASRGYRMYATEKGKIISSCTIPMAKIRDISQIAARFCKGHPILSHTSFFIRVARNPKIPDVRPVTFSDPPPLVILVTKSPYGNELALGAITFALACAHQEISTRVIFIEDGTYTLSGHHDMSEANPLLNLQSIIRVTSNTQNLEYYAYLPSIRDRGLSRTLSFRGVQPIEPSQLAQIFFQVPGGVVSDRQRVIIF